jgi:hypothetical protein
MEAGENTARDVLQAAQKVGWYVGIPLYDLQRRLWQLYAYDTTEQETLGPRTRQRTAVGRSEEDCINEMARCLSEISEGQPPP